MGKVSVTLVGGPLGGQTFEIGEHSHKLVVSPQWEGREGYDPTIGVYLKAEGWRYRTANPDDLACCEA